ncbi:MAG: UDP-N-acetylglucosamine 1-carboxyvinyltransferase, partial [Lachnospiraceae bacterium]|nr:UDP-N-acetylglucosamine 1-carboxyvinyltransferase [Lachnospiraceae bacterium]
MRRYAVKGGAPLVGEVEIGGAKNAALGILAAALMADETVEIENVPDLSDMDVMFDALRALGARVDKVNRHTVRINGSTVHTTTLLNEDLNKIRGSYYFVGALLGKYGNAEVILPGGCSIGSRPVDLHLKGFRALGATAEIDHACMVCNSEKLVGSHIFMDGVSVGATINIMLAAVMAEGQTYIENAAKEPHVVDVANFLNSMGASIKGAGTDVIRIKGVDRLHSTHYSIIPDQIEAGTYMMAAAATKGDVLIKNVIPKHLESITSKLLEIGCEIEEFDDAIRVVSSKPFYHTQVKTAPYPGFPTDMQPQITVALGLANGTSIVTESIFENRFKYVDELTRMGA